MGKTSLTHLHHKKWKEASVFILRRFQDAFSFPNHVGNLLNNWCIFPRLFKSQQKNPDLTLELLIWGRRLIDTFLFNDDRDKALWWMRESLLFATLMWENFNFKNIIISVVTNRGLGGVRFNSGPFLYCKYERGIKSLIFLHRVNNTEHNIKQNNYTGLKVISVIPPWYCL